MKIGYISIFFIVQSIGLLPFKSKAQLGPLSAQYFQTPYLANPAMTGMEYGLWSSLGVRAQWTNIPGTPKQQAFTVNYGNGRTGWGLNLNLDQAGLQRQFRALGSYAYHLPVGDEKALHFGLSVGISQQRLAINDIKGNQNDPQALNYNNRGAYFDGDFGIAYTAGKLKAEFALPNLDLILGRSQSGMVDVPTLYAALGYKFKLNDSDWLLEPKAAIRGIKGFKNIIDAGAALWVEDEQLMFMAIYHSSQSGTFGLGMNLKKRYRIATMYTTQTSSLGSYTNGSFELGLGMKIGK